MEVEARLLIGPPPPPLGEGGAASSPTIAPTRSTKFRPELLHGSRFHLNVELTDSSLQGQARGQRSGPSGEGWCWWRYLCEDVVSLAEDPAAVGIRSHQQLHRPDVDVTAQGPEVGLLQAVDALQVLHLKAPRGGRRKVSLAGHNNIHRKPERPHIWGRNHLDAELSSSPRSGDPSGHSKSKVEPVCGQKVFWFLLLCVQEPLAQQDGGSWWFLWRWSTHPLVTVGQGVVQ